MKNHIPKGLQYVHDGGGQKHFEYFCRSVCLSVRHAFGRQRYDMMDYINVRPKADV